MVPYEHEVTHEKIMRYANNQSNQLKTQLDNHERKVKIQAQCANFSLQYTHQITIASVEPAGMIPSLNRSFGSRNFEFSSEGTQKKKFSFQHKLASNCLDICQENNRSAEQINK